MKPFILKNWESILAEFGLSWEVLPLFLIIAFLYSSVGHGGASGYLALFALLGVARSEIAPVVLVLNIIVAVGGFINYYRAKHFNYKLLLPFIIGSIPGAFFGGLIKVPQDVFIIILGGVLLLASFRLLLVKNQLESRWEKVRDRIFLIGIPVGFLLGILAGITGIGGGIFLSPLLLLMGWADVKKTAAVSSAFIVLNSLSGLFAKVLSYTIHWDIILILGIVVVAGGQIGSRLGAYKFNPTVLQRLLGAVLLIAGLKMII
ncbi:MAG: sulfite exporter TauE/SafE family protein [Bacteroidetes bacterium]|nr:sulfite exporter TauE/SafE family protein [Bacteroidota bacterium]MBU2637256.1 sulfite exporter TauE/SafE family protein [Bacteroidota bacterium]